MQKMNNVNLNTDNVKMQDVFNEATTNAAIQHDLTLLS